MDSAKSKEDENERTGYEDIYFSHMPLFYQEFVHYNIDFRIGSMLCKFVS